MSGLNDIHDSTMEFGAKMIALGYRLAQTDYLLALVDENPDAVELWARHGKDWRDVKPMENET